MREVRHTFRNIDIVTRKNVIDLKRNIDSTYKQEPDFKLKKLRLKDFDEKRKQIVALITETDKIIDTQTIFFKTAMDVDLMTTIAEVRAGLRETTHGLIAIGAQIIDYLNRIDYQSRIVRKIRQLKYMRDQQMLTESSDIETLLANTNDVWMEPRPKYRTFVSLDFLRNDDASIDILEKVRSRLSKKTLIRSRRVMDGGCSTTRNSSMAFWHRAQTCSHTSGTILSGRRQHRRNGLSSFCSSPHSMTVTNGSTSRHRPSMLRGTLSSFQSYFQRQTKELIHLR